MRILPLIIFSAFTAGFVYILDTNAVLPAPLGKLLSPQHGVWQNAEKDNNDFGGELKFPQLKGKVDVYFDERLVPHVFAEQEDDVYFVQGYLHAKFRLWQMELQTHAAAGRASEIIGSKALEHDREFRRMGMGYAAEQSLKAMEADPETKSMCDAYTAGANSYISSLTDSKLPIEYKLIGYKPEPWTNLKTALFLKYMSYDLAGHDNDLEMTNAKSYFNKEDFDLLYPSKQDSADPIIPKETVYAAPKVTVTKPAAADSLYFNNKDLLALHHQNPDRDNGSNNWAVSGKKTKSGAPILCNDPHLGLNLPSLWFEMQLSTPNFNAYGVSFPGAPAIIIGYNDSCAFGFTNGGRDVKDYYKIRFKDDTRNEYFFNNEWKQTEWRVERIKVKDSLDYVDSVAYTLFGPVMYDKKFSGSEQTNNQYYALKWTAHAPSNELKLFYLLDRAKNYADYSAAILNLHTPGQNGAFACKSGDIAIRTQGDWPAKWKGQGDFVMPGTDSTFMWQGMIPADETPYQYNPERGFISSANQHPADSTYPYYLGNDYPIYRGAIINKRLTAMEGITPEDMMALQTNNYNLFAEEVGPVLLKNIKQADLNADEARYLEFMRNWNLNNDAGEKGATVFSLLWNHFYKAVYNDEYKNAPATAMRPFESTLVHAVLRDSAYKFIDNIETTQKESIEDIVTPAFKSATADLKKAAAEGKLEWAKHKATGVIHLTKLEPFSRLNLPIGGGTWCINAAKEDHGPSWRMVVSLTAETQAYAVYPGGQSGNPGSKFYDSFIDQWAQGKYYTLWLMKKEEAADKRVKWKMSFKKA
ncbi:MAG: penicillin acylase family protein [Chitinophagaceae bacterium]|nr:penicillin acylase family protein [Chitinophagaceae bacterium]